MSPFKMEWYLKILLTITIIFSCLSLFFYISDYRDQKQFLKINQTIQKDTKNQGDFIAKLNEWVYHKEGFAQNTGRYLWNKLGATPMQIYQKGGDCSDKSRLLSAMLRASGIRSNLVMLYDKKYGNPTHTVVEAEYEQGKMVVDPVFNIDFPKSEDGYYGVAYLRKNHDVFIQRLDQLIAERATTDKKISLYKRETETYLYPMTVNWQKNKIMTFIGETIIAKFSHDPYLAHRPALLENPKLFFSFMSFFAALSALFLIILLKIVL